MVRKYINLKSLRRLQCVTQGRVHRPGRARASKEGEAMLQESIIVAPNKTSAERKQSPQRLSIISARRLDHQGFHVPWNSQCLIPTWGVLRLSVWLRQQTTLRTRSRNSNALLSIQLL